MNHLATSMLPHRLEAMSFRGARLDTHTTVVEILEAGQVRPLPLHLEVRNHSPGGFEWGYSGSGPAQLALAMCTEVFGADQAQRVYQTVKDRLLAGLAVDRWVLPAASIAAVAAGRPPAAWPGAV